MGWFLFIVWLILMGGFVMMWGGLSTRPTGNDSAQNPGWGGWREWQPKWPPGNRNDI